MRRYALVGGLLLADGTINTRLTTYDVPDMETTLQRAAVVRRWRGERIPTKPAATVRDIIEVQVSADAGSP